MAGAAAAGAPAVSRAAVAAHILLPLTTGARTAAAPLRFGDGFVAADLGGGDDAADFARLLEVTQAQTPRQLAQEAQEWRLPVVDYRRRRAVVCAGAATIAQVRPRSFDGVVVLDLTAMWAGPLATALLMSLGAIVKKVEPDCRLDGMRGTPPMHEALNAGKQRLDLDLREAHGRSAFLEEAARADIVIDSFSPRVLTNFGLTPDVPVAVSMPAFPAASRERDWVAYGTGVHAASGLGDDAGVMKAPAVSYPDPIGGFAAFAAVCCLWALGKRARRVASLFGAVAPLAAVAPVPGILDAEPETAGAEPWPVFA